MRCNECGYANPDNAGACGKCQAPLSKAANFNAPPPLVGHHGSGKATIKGVNANMPYWDDTNASNSQMENTKSYKNCPSCGYVLMPDAVDCPNCESHQSAAPVTTKDAPPPPIAQVQGGKSAKSTMKLGTFNPMETEKKFSLTDNNSNQKTLFSGNNVEVNRANLDAHNSAISSQVHARFVYENGVWHVADESSNQATFVQVRGKVALEDGTVLIVGNKIMTFKSE